jgi:hypothetical protein
MRFGVPVLRRACVVSRTRSRLSARRTAGSGRGFGASRSRSRLAERLAPVVHPGHRDGLAVGDPAEEVDLTPGQRAELASGQAFDRDRADGDSGQHHDLVAELGQHPPDLSVLAFGENQFEDRRIASLADRPDPLGPNFSFGQPDSLGQLVENLASRRASDDHSIELLDPELGMGQLVGQLAVVGQEEEADAHLVEPTHGINPLGNLGEKVDDPGTARGVVVGRDVTFRLVDGEVDRPLDLHLLAIDGDRRLGQVDLGA